MEGSEEPYFSRKSACAIAAAAPADSAHEDGVLYEALSWAEIDAFLFGPRQREASSAHGVRQHVSSPPHL